MGAQTTGALGGAASGAATGMALGPIGAGVGAVVGGVIGWLKAKGTNDAVKEARELYNAYLTGRIDVANSIIEKAKANGFDPYGPQVTTRQGSGTSSSTTQGTQNSTTSSRPVITAEYAPMESQLRGLVEGRLGKGQFSNEEFVNRTLANRVRATNRTYANATSDAENRVARQGGGVLKSFGATTPINVARAGQIADAIGNVPMEARNLENQDLNLAQGAIGAFGRGETSNTQGRTSSSTFGSNTGSDTTTAPPNLSALFSMLAPVTPQAGQNTGFSPALQGGSDLLSSLAQLYANGAFKGGGGGGATSGWGYGNGGP